jgi:hypothetical protein
VTPSEALRDALARIVRLRDALADGDVYLADEIAAGLEADLLRTIGDAT